MCRREQDEEHGFWGKAISPQNGQDGDGECEEFEKCLERGERGPAVRAPVCAPVRQMATPAGSRQQGAVRPAGSTASVRKMAVASGEDDL